MADGPPARPFYTPRQSKTNESSHFSGKWLRYRPEPQAESKFTPIERSCLRKEIWLLWRLLSYTWFCFSVNKHQFSGFIRILPMKRRNFMLGVGASVALVLTKARSQESVRRPRLLISS